MGKRVMIEKINAQRTRVFSFICPIIIKTKSEEKV